jgi:glycosyltransferase involved in cell wall biosynthesis
MRIGISAEWIGTRAGGPEVYVSNLIHTLARIDERNQYRVYLSERRALNDYTKLGSRITPHLMWGRSRWVVIPFAQPLEMVARPVDLFHATFVAPPVCPAPFVLTVCELGFEKHPEFYPRLMTVRLSKLTRWGAKRALKILSISEYTKKDLVECYKVDPEKIEVVYLGVSERFIPMPDKSQLLPLLRKYQIPGPYILYVGKLEARKNVARLLRAYQQLRQNTAHQHQLVIVGVRSYLYADIDETLRELKLEKEVRILENVDRSDVPSLYNGASLFVFPSLLEAFGIPPLEAMACGIPVVVSNATAIPEIVGDAAVFVDPYDVSSIAEGMNKVLSDTELQKKLVAKGLQRAKRFSWEGTAKKTLSVYEQAYALCGNASP